jgi:phytoene dehydrogenase-like protein
VAILARNLALCAQHFGLPRDGEELLKIARWHARIEDRLFPVLLDPAPSLDATLDLGLNNMLKLVSVFGASCRSLSARLFDSEAARRVIPGLALHADVGPDDAFGSGLGYMLAMTATTGGYGVPQGGAQRLADALVRIMGQHGGTVRLGARVTRIVVRDERARGVLLENGEELSATEAVLADTSAPSLFLDLVEHHHLPSYVIRFMRRFPQGWGTFKVDWALNGPTPWSEPLASRSAVVHAGDSVDDLSRFTAQVRAGQLPEHPYLVVGQQSLLDPTRAPPGEHTLWAYSRVPSHVPGGWSTQQEAFADRMEERLEGLAPGFRQRVKARRVVTPDALQTMNANLVGGDHGGGSNAWHRQLIFRPVFPYFRYRTPVQRLYLCSSYATPGAGVHGMCGYNAARIALGDLH